MAVAKTMPRYTTGSDRQVQWAAAAAPTITAGRAGAGDHRKATDNRGERRSADRAGQHPVPECSPRSSDHLDCLSHGGSHLGLGPRWVRVTTVAHGHHWSPTVANGSEKPEVVGPLAHATAMLQAGDSDCGPEGHPLWHPWTLPAGITCDVLPFGLPVRWVKADGHRRWYRPTGGLGRTGRGHHGRTLVSGLRQWWALAWDGLGRSRTGHG